MAAPAVVVIRGLAKTYRAGLAGCSAHARALDEVDLELRRGEILALVGSSGAGKTTLLLCVAGIVVPDRGIVTVRGAVDDRATAVCYFSEPLQAARADAQRGAWDLCLLDNVDQVRGDVASAFALVSLVKAARKRGATMLVAARDEQLVRGIADRFVELERGRLAAQPTIARLPVARVAEEAGPLTVIPGAPSIR